MTTAPKTCITPEEYLALDGQSEFPNEYVEGEVFPIVTVSKSYRRLC